ncbi:MAG TPA: hypothetical protein VEY50_08405 [Lysobacter sp.]|nr:hypothetical protein [Lysobacter sp.]
MSPKIHIHYIARESGSGADGGSVTLDVVIVDSIAAVPNVGDKVLIGGRDAGDVQPLQVAQRRFAVRDDERGESAFIVEVMVEAAPSAIDPAATGQRRVGNSSAPEH